MALKNHQFQALMRAYDLRQSMNANIQSKRIHEVYSEIPEIAQIDQEVSRLSLEQARRLLDGDEAALDLLKTQLKALSSKKYALLEEYGFDKDYMDPVYTCTDCKDTGFIRNEKCHCFIQASIDLLYSQSNLRDILEKENFCTFQMDYYSDEEIDPVTGLSSRQAMIRAVEESRVFIRKFSYDYQNLLFYGSTGVGKTFLTHCIAKELIENSVSVLYFSATELFKSLADSTFSKTESTLDSLTENLYNCDLLIIDDLGTEVVNSFVASSLFTCLETRDTLKKATIISTNLSLHDIRDKYSDRIFSRLSSRFKVIKLFGKDIRIQQKLQLSWRS